MSKDYDKSTTENNLENTEEQYPEENNESQFSF